MKNIENGFAADLATGHATTCLCFKLTRQDGQVFGATNHDQAVIFQGVEYKPDHALDGFEFSDTLGLAPGTASLTGSMSVDFLDEADLMTGLWDRASLSVWCVDWKTSENGCLIWSGLLGEIRRSGARFETELVSERVQLEKRIGRVYARQCDAALGDHRCGVDLAAYGDEVHCDKWFETCRDTFSNTLNYRGYPHLPGVEAVLQGPSVRRMNNGGQR